MDIIQKYPFLKGYTLTNRLDNGSHIQNVYSLFTSPCMDRCLVYFDPFLYTYHVHIDRLSNKLGSYLSCREHANFYWSQCSSHLFLSPTSILWTKENRMYTINKTVRVLIWEFIMIYFFGVYYFTYYSDLSKVFKGGLKV